MNENARKWVAALRSGEYMQTQGVLHQAGDTGERPVGYCCLGVACQIAIDNGVDLKIQDDDAGSRHYDSSYDLLPPEVMRWLGIHDEAGSYFDEPDESGWNLAEANDGGATFEQIADIIEKHADQLFVDEPEAQAAA